MATRPSDPEETQAANPTGVRELPLVALRETVIFPEMIVPLQVGRDKSVNALNAAVAASGPIALVTQRSAEQEDINDPSELYPVGTLAKIAQVVQLQDGTVRAIVQGQGRLRVHGFSQVAPHIVATIEELADATPGGVEVQALMRTVQAQIEQYVANGAPVPPEAAVAARIISEPGLLADMVAYSPDMSTEQRQELLETVDVTERLKLVSNFLARQIEILELKGRIQSEVKSEMDKTQREYILREQLKAIQRELGEDDPQQAEINELRDKVEAAGMPDEIKARAIKEVDRMSRIPSASPEVGVIRMDFRGDPSSALLEVLDPEQNNTFQDNYLEVPFDLSKVLFVATANLLDPIPAALRDRMENVHLPGYTEMEKIEIGKRFLIPKQMKNHGLKPSTI